MSQSQCGRSPSQARLPVVALVSHYLTNKLIGRGLILHRRSFRTAWMPKRVSIRY